MKQKRLIRQQEGLHRRRAEYYRLLLRVGEVRVGKFEKRWLTLYRHGHAHVVITMEEEIEANAVDIPEE